MNSSSGKTITELINNTPSKRLHQSWHPKSHTSGACGSAKRRPFGKPVTNTRTVCLKKSVVCHRGQDGQP